MRKKSWLHVQSAFLCAISLLPDRIFSYEPIITERKQKQDVVYIEKGEGWNEIFHQEKLIMSSMLISIIFGVSAFISYTSMKEMNRDYDYIIDNITEVNTNAQSIQNEATRQVSYIRGYLLYGTSEMKENVYTSNEKINQLIAQAKDISSVAATDRQLEDIQESNAAWIAENTKLIEVAAKDVNEAKKLAQEKVVPISTKLGEQTYALNESTEGVIKAKVKEAKEQSEKATDKIMIISIFAFIFAIAAGWLTANLISKPLKKLGLLPTR